MYLQAKRLVLFLSLFSTGAWAEEAQRFQMNLKPGITEVGHQIYDLHMLIMGICTVVAIGVFAFMLYSLIAHRKSVGHEPAHFHENTVVELAWTIIPTIILILMAIPASKTLIEIYDTSDADLDILITGYQWKWKYEYVIEDGENVSFFSSLRTSQDEINNIDTKGEHYLLEVDNALYLPVNKKARFLVTANDVIHAWWVPALAVKKDAIPGFVNEAWAKPMETGIYRGQCAELCGKDHGFMPIVVNIVEQEEFDTWLGEKRAEAAKLAEIMKQEMTMDQLVAKGEEVYAKSCLACHGAKGEGGIGKAIAGSPIATGDLNGHMDSIVNGVPGTAMQAFGNQLNPIELAAVITYQRNAFGNNMGDKVQPIDVYNFKQQ